MANVLFLAKEDLPSSMLPEMNKFMMYQGLSKLADLCVDSRTSYEHSTSIDEFQDSLSDVVEEDLLLKIKESSKFSLMIDERTDISVHQKLIIYIRILEKNNVDVVLPQKYFLSINSLYRADAESIYSKVVNTLGEKGIDITKLTKISTDGASVMVGNKSGVVNRLKADNPGLLATHCIAHRLALSCCSGADVIPFLVKVQEILNSVYKYFSLSPKNTAMLEAIQKITPGQAVLQQVPVEPRTGDDGLETFEFQGHTIRDSSKQRQEAVSICDSFSAGIIRSMNDRFADNHDAGVLTSLSILFNPAIAKDSKVKHVDVVAEYLCSVGFEGCLESLGMFMNFMQSLVDSGNKIVGNSRDSANLAIKKKDVYPAAAEAAERLLVAPVSTVDCERGFSKQNLIKTCLRNRLHDANEDPPPTDQDSR
ncbi:uncharacterized protein LOC127839652 [Dreissena polymorpha]|uniref:uncharacterized protein LOC127839652 n=1 Tax=Dreissena polymorpha TaxID=45954 RepID=UPI002263BFB5|nr:uncharacterized protein LOC127839652 [Dreissena polymorpha]